MKVLRIMAALAVTALVAGSAAATATAAPASPFTAAYTTTASGVTTGFTAKVGTCSGSSKTAWRTQSIKNTYGTTLAYIKLSTTWYYNGSRVTCAYSARTPYVTTYGALGGWEFKGWTDFGEQFYTYNSRTNGGVKTWTSGWFKGCNRIVGKELCSTGTTTARTYVHYDGTYSTGGYTG